MTKLRIYCRRGHGKGGYHRGGLVSNALHTVAVLGEAGYDVALREVDSEAGLWYEIARERPTHAIAEGIWISQISPVVDRVKFLVRAHSKSGFLQVEPEAIALMRALRSYVASNDPEFACSLSEAWHTPVACLPNLYDSGLPCQPIYRDDNVLWVGSFGASRLLKMHPSAALAALQIARRAGKQLRFSVNVDGTPGGDSVRRSVREVLEGRADLIQMPWQSPAAFREAIGCLDLVLVLSATETFCLVAADAVAAGVPVVAGPAIRWLPDKYKAPIDETSVVADVAIRALMNPRRTVRRQRRALDKHCAAALKVWRRWLF